MNQILGHQCCVTCMCVITARAMPDGALIQQSRDAVMAHARDGWRLEVGRVVADDSSATCGVCSTTARGIRYELTLTQVTSPSTADTAVSAQPSDQEVPTMSTEVNEHALALEWLVNELIPLRNRWASNYDDRDGYDLSDEWYPFPNDNSGVFYTPGEDNEDADWREKHHTTLIAQRICDALRPHRFVWLTDADGDETLWFDNNVDALIAARHVYQRFLADEFEPDAEDEREGRRQYAIDNLSAGSQLQRAREWAREALWELWLEDQPSDRDWFSCENLRAVMREQVIEGVWDLPLEHEEVATLARGESVPCPACISGRFRMVNDGVSVHEADTGLVHVTADWRCSNSACGLGHRDIDDHVLIGGDRSTFDWVMQIDEQGLTCHTPITVALDGPPVVVLPRIVTVNMPSGPPVVVSVLTDHTEAPGLFIATKAEGLTEFADRLARLYRFANNDALTWPPLNTTRIEVVCPVEGHVLPIEYDAAIFVGVRGAVSLRGGERGFTQAGWGWIDLDANYVKVRAGQLLTMSPVQVEGEPF